MSVGQGKPKEVAERIAVVSQSGNAAAAGGTAKTSHQISWQHPHILSRRHASNIDPTMSKKDDHLKVLPPQPVSDERTPLLAESNGQPREQDDNLEAQAQQEQREHDAGTTPIAEEPNDLAAGDQKDNPEAGPPKSDTPTSSQPSSNAGGSAPASKRLRTVFRIESFLTVVEY